MAPNIMKGLKDVYLDTTESSFIDGQEGKLLYRGYNIHDLAEQSTFAQTSPSPERPSSGSCGPFGRKAAARIFSDFLRRESRLNRRPQVSWGSCLSLVGLRID